MNTGEYNVMALDDGYGDIKYNSKGIPALLPSFVTPFKPKPTDEFTGKESSLPYIASEVDGERYLVGDYAMRLDPNIRWVGGENKHMDSKFPILLKTTLGLMSSHQEETINMLTMNLPVRYDTPSRRETLENLVVGEHRVGISFDGVNYDRKVIYVEKVDIKKQPFGSLCDVLLDDTGEIVNPDIAKGFTILVDIGARTVNIMTLSSLKEQPELTTQTSDGMFAAYNQIGNYIENELGVMIPDGKLPQIVQDKIIRNKNLTPLIDAVYEGHANTILTTLDKMMISSWGFVTSVIFTGGGAEILRPYIEGNPLFTGVDVIFLDRFSNVRGLRRHALRQARKIIYDLKQ